MNEGSFGVDKKHVRYPDFLHQPAIKGHALVGGAGKGQSLVLPVMSQVQGHGEVLKHTIQSAIRLNINSLNSRLISIPRALYLKNKHLECLESFWVLIQIPWHNLRVEEIMTALKHL